MNELIFDIIADKVRTAKAKADPRIEDLVKQAEAIKPGSGAEVRKALEKAPKAAATGFGILEWSGAPPANKPALQFHFADPSKDKKIIVLQIEDGKVIQLQNAELKKFLDKEKPAAPGNPAGAANKAATDAFMKMIQGQGTFKLTPPPPASPGIPGVGTTPPKTSDVEALARQLERLSRELNELRTRLEVERNEHRRK